MVKNPNFKIIALFILIFLGGIFAGYLAELLIPLFNIADFYNQWGFWGTIGRIGIAMFIFSVPLGYFLWLITGIFQITRPREPQENFTISPQIANMSQISRILVPFGDGPNALLGLQLVSHLKNLRENGLITLYKILPTSMEDRVHQQKKQLENTLHQSLLEYQKDFKVEVIVEVSNEVVNPIIELAKNGRYDLLVVGASEWSHVGRFLFGSIPQQIAQQSPCPIVIVRKPADHPPTAV